PTRRSSDLLKAGCNMSIDKKDVIKLLEQIALLLELKGENPFKVSAYRKAAQSLERDVRSLAEIDDVTKLKGIGKGTGAVIKEYVETGQSTTLTQLEAEVPEGLVPLLQLPGLGGRKLAKLYQSLHITDAESLKKACESGQVGQLEGFGKKTVENILTALADAGKRPERLPIATMLSVAEKIEKELDRIPSIDKYSRTASLHRRRKKIKDIDYNRATEKPEAVRDDMLGMDGIKDVVSKGTTKVSVVLADVYDVNVDFRLVRSEAFATMLHPFTGSKDHNVAIRQLAKARGEKINEYGVEKEDTKETITFPSEEALFHHFGLHYIPPEIRENTGEIESARRPLHLIDIKDIRGDLHMHTTWSDGAQSPEEMVNNARANGYEYMAITDHSKYLRVADGLNETRLLKQREEIARLNAKYNDIHIFAGVEMDILPDGTLDFSNDFLQEMDFVIAAIHSGFNQPEAKIMERLYAAMDSPYVSLIAHPTGRLIGQREGYRLNMEKLIMRAKETDTALEINANPNRLDLSAEWAQTAQKIGVKLAINTDAHSYSMFDHMDYGIATARKGRIHKDTVINTWPLEQLKAFLNRNK